MFRQLKLSTKLFGAFTLILLLLAIVAAVGFSGLKKTATAFQTVAHSLDISNDANKIADDLQTAQAQALRFVIYKDRKYADDRNKGADETLRIANNTMEKMATAEDKARAEHLISSMKEYDRFCDEYFALEQSKSETGKIRAAAVVKVLENVTHIIEITQKVALNTDENGQIDRDAVERAFFAYKCMDSVNQFCIDGYKCLLGLTAADRDTAGKKWLTGIDKTEALLKEAYDMMPGEETRAIIQDALKATQNYKEQVVAYRNIDQEQFTNMGRQKENALAAMTSAHKVTERIHTYINQLKTNTEHLVERMNTVIVTTSIISIITGMLVAFILTRGIANPIKNIVQALTNGSEQVFAASNQVSSASQSLAEGATEQAAGLEETSSSLEEMTSMTKQSSANAHQTNVLAGEARRAAEIGNESMKKMSAAINDIQQSSSETAKIIKVIDEIAFQTNLLALNAAVEAARAGEAGKGFAVVAEEVRNLAKRSAEAAKNTSELIQRSVNNAQNGVEITNEVGKALQDIVSNIAKTSDLTREIASAAEEQTQGISQINIAVSQMDEVTQANAANAEESASAAEELSTQSAAMNNIVSELQQLIEGTHTSPHSPPTDSPIIPRKRTDATMALPPASATSQIPFDEDLDAFNG